MQFLKVSIIEVQTIFFMEFGHYFDDFDYFDDVQVSLHQEYASVYNLNKLPFRFKGSAK